MANTHRPAIVKALPIAGLAFLALGIWLGSQHLISAGLVGLIMGFVGYRLTRPDWEEHDPPGARRRPATRRSWFGLKLRHRKRYKLGIFRFNTSWLRWTSTAVVMGPLTRNATTKRWTLNLPFAFFLEWGGGRPRSRGRR